MTVHVFAGPTIGAEAVRERLPEALVHPPVRHGDLLAIAPRPGDTIAIIDGLFFRTGAIRHKELLHVLQRGVAVWGASSMGALRAAELDVFGMRGVGTVYNLYASGTIDADDEVAVMHADAEAAYRPMNEALVSVRTAARRAADRAILTAAEADIVVAAAKDIFFADRRYPQIIAAARATGLTEQQAARFAQFAARERIDVKREDAELLLDHLARALEEGGPRPAARHGDGEAPVMPMTSFLLRWIRMSPGPERDGERVCDMAALTACQLFAPQYPALHYKTLLRTLARGELEEGCTVPDDDLAAWEQLACDAAARRGLIASGPRKVPPLLAQWLSDDERTGAVVPAIARALVRSFRWSPNVRPIEPLVAALSGTDSWSAARRHAAAAAALNTRIAAMRPTFNVHYIADAKLEAWLGKRWQTDDVLFAMRDRGFSSPADLRARAAEFLAIDTLEGVEPIHLDAVGALR